MTHELAQALRDIINARIVLLDLPIFLQEEVYRFLQYVHYYKLKNIEKHLDVFCDYLVYLDKAYTAQLINYLQKDVLASTFSPDGASSIDMSYYLSVQGANTLATSQLLPILVRDGFDNYNVLTVMLCAK